MKPCFALNYSTQAASLVAAGTLFVDRFKCPPWRDLIAKAAKVRPVYVHYSLHAGRGDGVVRDSSGRPADWADVEALLESTSTPFVNVHLAPVTAQQPGIPRTSVSKDHVELMAAAMTADVTAAVRRLGAERVVVENDYDDGREQVVAATVPEAIRMVVAETGCGLLLDVSHARLAAQALDMDERDYLSRLPLGKAKEIHLTGIGHMSEPWLSRMAANGVPADKIAALAGRRHDHLPLTDTDWTFMAWVAEQVAAGVWGRPWAVALEYGGEGPLWQAITDEKVLAEQLPRLQGLFDQADREYSAFAVGTLAPLGC